MTSPDGITWTIRTSAADNSWYSVTYGNNLFVAVAITGAGNLVMTSPDGITWTIRTSAANNQWRSVTYGNGLFVAVAGSGTGNRVMTSPDGINWTSRTSAANNQWYSVTYGNGLFVAVAINGAGNRVMTSPDGINWTLRTYQPDLMWRSVTYGNGLFVAVAQSGTGNRVMTSPDGITWTSRTSAADNQWYSVTYGNGLFVAVAQGGTVNQVMTSPDGITWTGRTAAAAIQWQSVTYGNNRFVAVAYSGTGNQVMTSLDGSTWTSQNAAAANQWLSVTYGNNLFVAVAYSGTGNRVMTSPDGSTWTSRTSAADNNWISVTYGNNRFVAVAQSGAGNRVMISVGPTPTTLTLASSLNPSTYGSSVIFTATVSPSAATDTVTFNDGGTTLGTRMLSGGTATYSTSALSLGDHSITAEYGGDGDYGASTSNPLTQAVNKATPNVTTWPTATAITYGQTLASSTLSGGAATPTGSFAWTTASTAPGAGTASQSVTFTPTDTGNYTTVTGTADVTVNKATPLVNTWPTASAITYGQTLASSTLSGGSASVAGDFAFTTPSTAPGVGTALQSVTFTPTVTANYNPVIGSVSVTVNPPTRTPVKDGSWNDPATWGGTVPATGDDVVLPAGITVDLVGAVGPFRNLTIAGTLNLGANTLQVSGNFTNKGTFNYDTGTVQLVGGADQILAATTPGTLTFYNLTVNKDPKTATVTATSKLKATKKLTITKGKLISASDYVDILIETDGELVLTDDITVSGNLVVQGDGTLTTDGHMITFDGETAQNLTLASTTWFDDVTVTAGTTLIETESGDYVQVQGTLSNLGVIRKTQPVGTAVSGPESEYFFGLAGSYNGEAIKIHVTDLTGAAPLTAIQVDRVDANHPHPPGSGVTGIYWTITPTGNNYVADLTLPCADGLTAPKVCRYTATGGAGFWDWAGTVTGSTVTRTGITKFSDWAVYDNPQQGDVIWGPGGTYAWEMANATGSPGAGWDWINITGDLTITATNKPVNTGQEFTIAISGAGANFDNTKANSWVIATASGAVNLFNANKFILTTTGFTPDGGLGGGTFSVVLQDKSVVLLFTPASTPCTAITTASFTTTTTPPSAEMTFINASGLSSVQAMVMNNCVISGIAYDSGNNPLTPNPIGTISLVARTPLPDNTVKVVLTATKEAAGPSTVNVMSIDACGRGKSFDPMFTSLLVAAGGVVEQRLTGIPQVERYLQVFNGQPGLRSLAITVNGQPVPLGALVDGESRALDLGAFLAAGQANTLVFTGRGELGANAFLVLTETPTGAQLVAAPALAVALTTEGVTLSWPDLPSQWQLQARPALDGTWENVPATPAVQGGHNTVALSLNAESRFFRLQAVSTAAAASAPAQGSSAHLSGTNSQPILNQTYDAITW